VITKEHILALVPRPRQQYLDCFENPNVLLPFDINTPLREAHFLAQILHESGGFSILTESLNYSHAERLMAVWPSRFPNKEAARPYVGNAAALAEKVYGGRMGNTAPGDGYLYLGRGPLQITGRDSYNQIGQALGLDLIHNPNLAITPPHMIHIAAYEFAKSRCNEAADNDNLLQVSARVNVGHDVSSAKFIVGYNERADWLRRTKSVLGLKG
jgi:putative chitinase